MSNMADREFERLKEVLERNLRQLQQRIGDAAVRADRSAGEVTLVAVTKLVGAAEAQALVDLGVNDLGENRPQELWKKAEAVQGAVRWHQVGHLQRNKVRRTLPLVHMIHSADSLRLLRSLDEEASRQKLASRVLIEVNTSGEASKFGFDPEGLVRCWPEIFSIEHVRIEGLMTIAPLVPEAEQARPAFRRLRELRDRLQDLSRGRLELKHLSMGMTNDFGVAIEEGATLVRIGTALYGGWHRQGSTSY